MIVIDEPEQHIFRSHNVYKVCQSNVVAFPANDISDDIFVIVKSATQIFTLNDAQGIKVHQDRFDVKVYFIHEGNVKTKAPLSCERLKDCVQGIMTTYVKYHRELYNFHSPVSLSYLMLNCIDESIKEEHRGMTLSEFKR